MNANNLKNGDVIVHDNSTYVIIKQPEHTKPGKGKAYVQVEMKNIKTNVKVNKRFGATDHIEKAFLEQRKFQYIFAEKDSIIFMDMDTYEQISIVKTIMDKRLGLLKEGMIVEIEMLESEPIYIHLPKTVVMQIEETEPVIKGATITSSYKLAILENNVPISVPSYLAAGEKIHVKTSDIKFFARYKDE